ncbi:MAG: hypothetical protein ABEJ75_04385 [Candidatus Nanohaloarchaea archaeon]
MASEWIERKVEDVILGLIPLPYADREVVEIAESVIGVEGIPGLPPLHLQDMSTGEKILLLIFGAIPLLDVEYLDLFGLDPFKNAEGTGSGETPTLDSPAFDRTKKMGGGNNRLATDGGRQGGGGSGSGAAGVVKGFLKTALKLSPLLLIVGALFLMTGFLSSSGYGAVIGNQLGLQLVGMDFEEEVNAIRQGIQTIKCFGNVACMRQWQANHTRRPGYEDRGESYRLQIEDTSINSGYPIDIVNRPKDYVIPLSFSLYNPRHGMKGIPAQGVKFQVIVEGASTVGKEVLCRSGWKTVKGTYADVFNLPAGTIMGGGFASPVGKLESINLKNCKLLQPGNGWSARAYLKVRYNYSSQATLYFQAMSWKNLKSLGERPSFKPSKTADTPVKSYVTVESPVTYVQHNGVRYPDVFPVRVEVKTKYDIKYRLNPESLVIKDPSATIDVKTVKNDVKLSEPVEEAVAGAECTGLRRVGENTYKLSQEQIEYIKMLQEDSWFTESQGLSPAYCSMVLSHPQRISRSGETLLMRVDANYTVLKEEGLGEFTVKNSKCGLGVNCPMLIPQDHNKEVESGGWEYDSQEWKYLSLCSPSIHPDAANGCDVRSLPEDRKWGVIGEPINAPSVDAQIETGEYAIKNWREYLQIPQPALTRDTSTPGSAIGLTEEVMDNIEGGVSSASESGDALVEGKFGEPGHRRSDVRYLKVDPILCKESKSRTKFRKAWTNHVETDTRQIDRALVFNPRTLSCATESAGDLLLELISLSTYKSPREKYNAFESKCHPKGGVVVLQSGMKCMIHQGPEEKIGDYADISLS